MTFPANYAVIAEDELTYVTGGNIWDAFPAAMASENWRTFGTNLIKIVGNTFLGKFVGSILGTAFGTNYAFGGIVDALNDNFAGMDLPNTILQVMGGAAAVYTLGANDAAVLQAKKVVDVDGTV